MTELASERVRLRQWRNADLTPFAALNADPAVMEHFPAPLSRAASDALAQRERGRIATRGWGLWALEVVGAPAPADRSVVPAAGFAGFVGLAIPGFEAPFTPAVEVGWRLARPAWGHGYATEAARLALTYAFDELGLAEVVSFTFAGNARSRRVMERLDMTRNPADDFTHPLLPGHRIAPHVLYRLQRPPS